jgi:hypothetical protein
MMSMYLYISSTGIVGRVGRATARDALCRGFDPCRQRPRGVAVDFSPKQSGWLIKSAGQPQFLHTGMYWSVQSVAGKLREDILVTLDCGK